TAQNRIGIDYYKIGDYDLAKRYLEKEVIQYPAESYYYLGEIAFAQGKIEEAKSYYNKGLNVAPENPFNKIGVAKADFKKNWKYFCSINSGYYRSRSFKWNSWIL
ncbi:MAG: tetratricopeptide repeat protein, partial [Bacteroidales bacterium]